MVKQIIPLLLLMLLLTGCMDQPSSAPSMEPETTEAERASRGANIDSPAGSSLVGDPVINRFTVAPATIQPEGKALLIWNVSNATYVSINQGIGQVDATGSIEVSPMVQTAYVITATNLKGSTFAKVTLTVQAQGVNTLPVILEFISDPVIPKKGQSARLRWTTRGATQVSIDNVPVQANGDKLIRLDGPTTFMIMATNSYGSEIKYLSVQVND